MESGKQNKSLVGKLGNIKKDKFIEFYMRDEVRGNISLTCDAVGINRQTYYNWLEADENFRNAIYESKLRLCDDMEQVLISRAVDKDTTALIFWLKKNHDKYADTPLLMQQVNVGGKDGNTITFVNFKNESES